MPRIHKFSERRIINARGPYTPLGVSRSPKPVASAVFQALLDFADISALQDEASIVLSNYAGSGAGTVVHCAAAGITLAIAAAMTGSDPDRIAALPYTAGLRHRVVLPAGHAVNYGHPIEQAIRLSGARPVLVGDEVSCPVTAIAKEIAHSDTCCLLLVVSRLTKGAPVDFDAAIKVARENNVPVVVDGAAQIFKAPQLIQNGADLLIVSGQKYLGSPTAGLVFGRPDLVSAVRAQDRGIGRGMKASKEALCGVIEAIEQWRLRNDQLWAKDQVDKVNRFVHRLDKLHGVTAISEPDSTDAPFPRVCLEIDPNRARLTAKALANELKSGSPSIWVMDHRIANNEVLMELVPLGPDEIDVLLDRVVELLS